MQYFDMDEAIDMAVKFDCKTKEQKDFYNALKHNKNFMLDTERLCMELVMERCKKVYEAMKERDYIEDMLLSPMEIE